MYFLSIIKPYQGILADPLDLGKAFLTDTVVISSPPTARRKRKTSVERKTSRLYFLKKESKPTTFDERKLQE